MFKKALLLLFLCYSISTIGQHKTNITLVKEQIANQLNRWNNEEWSKTQYKAKKILNAINQIIDKNKDKVFISNKKMSFIIKSENENVQFSFYYQKNKYNLKVMQTLSKNKRKYTNVYTFYAIKGVIDKSESTQPEKSEWLKKVSYNKYDEILRRLETKEEKEKREKEAIGTEDFEANRLLEMNNFLLILNRIKRR